MTYPIAFVLYPRFEELDFAGPWEVFGAAARSVAPQWKPYTVGPVHKLTGAHGLTVEADHTFADAPPPAIIVVPGGDALHALDQPGLAEWVRTAGDAAAYVASVCTGAFILDRAGFLDGKRVTTHWSAKEYLRKSEHLTVCDERWVHDGKIITAAGVSAGIDMALYLVGVLLDPKAARGIQEYMEYHPEPPYQDLSL